MHTATFTFTFTDLLLVADDVPLLGGVEPPEVLGALRRQVHLHQHLVEPPLQLGLVRHRRPVRGRGPGGGRGGGGRRRGHGGGAVARAVAVVAHGVVVAAADGLRPGGLAAVGGRGGGGRGLVEAHGVLGGGGGLGVGGRAQMDNVQGGPEMKMDVIHSRLELGLITYSGEFAFRHRQLISISKPLNEAP